MSDSMSEWPSEKRVESMTEAELDDELRANGIDPEKLIQDTFQKVCVVARTQSLRIAALESALRLARMPVTDWEWKRLRILISVSTEDVPLNYASVGYYISRDALNDLLAARAATREDGNDGDK